MSLTRKFLAAMGIEPDKIDQIIEAHTDTVDALKKERDGYKTDADKLPGIQQELDELKEAAEKNKDNPYKAQYEDLKKEYDKYKDDVAAEKKSNSQKDAYRKLLKEAGVSEKRIEAILKVSDTSSVEFDDKGEVKDSGKIIDGMKKEWADFIPKTEERGAGAADPPGGNGSGGGKSLAAQIGARYYASMYGDGGKKE